MGMYDTFGELQIQLKVGDCRKNYKIGDEILDMPDGVYVGYEGVVVIKDGKFIAEFSKLYSKWGHDIDPNNIIDHLNPITKAIKQVENKLKEKEK